MILLLQKKNEEKLKILKSKIQNYLTNIINENSFKINDYTLTYHIGSAGIGDAYTDNRYGAIDIDNPSSITITIYIDQKEDMYKLYDLFKSYIIKTFNDDIYYDSYNEPMIYLL